MPHPHNVCQVSRSLNNTLCMQTTHTPHSHTQPDGYARPLAVCLHVFLRAHTHARTHTCTHTHTHTHTRTHTHVMSLRFSPLLGSPFPSLTPIPIPDPTHTTPHHTTHTCLSVLAMVRPKAATGTECSSSPLSPPPPPPPGTPLARRSCSLESILPRWAAPLFGDAMVAFLGVPPALDVSVFLGLPRVSFSDPS